jgi:hypothetical protein
VARDRFPSELARVRDAGYLLNLADATFLKRQRRASYQTRYPSPISSIVAAEKDFDVDIRSSHANC